mgnify:CR=1 FL=1|tara:strand:+ start:452 stop:814 length:363 start_codon:yes stop_codon:yes gene_type:complete
MKIEIYRQIENQLIQSDELKDMKTKFESLTAEVNGLSFSTDAQSLLRLDIISHSNNIINFKNYENEVIPLSGTEIANYNNLLKTKLADRYATINEIYFNLREDSNLTYAQAVSVFESLDI